MAFCGRAVWKGIFESFTLTEVISSMPIQFLLRSVLACRVIYIAFEKGLVRSVRRLTKCFTFANAVRGGMLQGRIDVISRRWLLMLERPN